MNIDDKIEHLSKLPKPQSAALKKLGLNTVRDLLLYFPYRYLDFSNVKPIRLLKPGEMVSVKAAIKNIASRFSFRDRLSLTEALVSDDTGTVKIVWFNQPYLAKSLHKGEEIFIAGTPEIYNKILQFNNPIYEKASEFPVHTARLLPVYHLTAKLYPRTLRNLIAKSLPFAKQLIDDLPPRVLNSQNLPALTQTVEFAHFPKKYDDVILAKKRLAFEEIFINQLAGQRYKIFLSQKQAFSIQFNQPLIKNFVDSLPFRLTKGQKQAAWEVLQDLEKTAPMNRLLEGDVGSGKTAVALTAALQAMARGFQVAFLAPTEILAKQHSNTALKFFASPKLDGRQVWQISLLTNTYSQTNGKKISRASLSTMIADGSPGLYLGTHALLEGRIKFKNLALVIIDEQHRFGVNQRAALIRGTTQTETPTNADKQLLYEELTYKIRNCIFEVKKEIGLGHKEIVYQNALALKFQEKKIRFEKEKNIAIFYKGKKIGSYQPDFVIEDKIILELKSLLFTGTIENRQTWTYLKGSIYKLALLVNFGPDDVNIKRIIYDAARQRKSASSPRESATQKVPHLLSLSATPIPRSLQLAFFGELDISQIKEKPADRKTIITRVVNEANRGKAYEFIKKQILAGRQVFVITPLIEESDSLGAKAAKSEIENLKKVFPEFRIGLLHGKISGKDKEKVMKDFLENQIHILVSTSVVEVGVDVPNASVMIIEGAERFGLAQLHQFRGRVGRAEHQSFCFVFSSYEDPQTKNRLELFAKTQDGFELAELDLKLRGFGELYGSQQSGFQFKYFDPAYVSLIQPAREEARKLLSSDENLDKYPSLKAKIQTKTIHFE